MLGFCTTKKHVDFSHQKFFCWRLNSCEERTRRWRSRESPSSTGCMRLVLVAINLGLADLFSVHFVGFADPNLHLVAILLCSHCPVRTWAEGLACSALYPSTLGHQQMFSCIDKSIFDPLKALKAGHHNFAETVTRSWRGPCGFTLQKTWWRLDDLKVRDLLQKRKAEQEEMWRLCFKDGRQLGRCRHSTRLCKPNCASIQISQPFWNYGLFSSSLGYTNIPACSQWAVLFLPSTASPEGPRDTLLFCSNGAKRSSTAVLEAFVIGPGAAILLILRHSTLVYWSMFHNVSSYFCSSIESTKNSCPCSEVENLTENECLGLNLPFCKRSAYATCFRCQVWPEPRMGGHASQSCCRLQGGSLDVEKRPLRESGWHARCRLFALLRLGCRSLKLANRASKVAFLSGCIA